MYRGFRRYSVNKKKCEFDAIRGDFQVELPGRNLGKQGHMLVGHSQVWGESGPGFGIGDSDAEREEVECEVWKTGRMVFFWEGFWEVVRVTKLVTRLDDPSETGHFRTFLAVSQIDSVLLRFSGLCSRKGQFRTFSFCPND